MGLTITNINKSLDWTNKLKEILCKNLTLYSKNIFFNCFFSGYNWWMCFIHFLLLRKVWRKWLRNFSSQKFADFSKVRCILNWKSIFEIEKFLQGLKRLRHLWQGVIKGTEQKLQQTLRSKKNQKSLRKKKTFNAKKTEN